MMALFTLFVLLPTEEICTLRNVQSSSNVTDIRSRLELSAGLPSQIYELTNNNGKIFEEKYMFEFGCNVWDGFLLRVQMKKIWNSLFNAIITEDLESLQRERQVLVQTCCGSDSKDNEKAQTVIEEIGSVALYLGCWIGSEKICQDLINFGVNPNGLTPFKRTALFAATAQNNEQILHILLAGGAHLSAEDCNGDTPLDIARRNSAKQCIFRIREFWLKTADKVIKTTGYSSSGDLSGEGFEASDNVTTLSEKISHLSTSRSRHFMAKIKENIGICTHIERSPSCIFTKRSVAFNLEDNIKQFQDNTFTSPSQIDPVKPAEFSSGNWSQSSGKLITTLNVHKHFNAPNIPDSFTFRLALPSPTTQQNKNTHKNLIIKRTDQPSNSKSPRNNSTKQNEYGKNKAENSKIGLETTSECNIHEFQDITCTQDKELKTCVREYENRTENIIEQCPSNEKCDVFSLNRVGDYVKLNRDSISECKVIEYIDMDKNGKDISVDKINNQSLLKKTVENFSLNQNIGGVSKDNKENNATSNARNAKSATNVDKRVGKSSKQIESETIENSVRPKTAGITEIGNKNSNLKSGVSWKTAMRHIQLAESQKRKSLEKEKTRETFEQWLRKKRVQENNTSSQDDFDDSSSDSDDKRKKIPFQDWLQRVRQRSKHRQSMNSASSLNDQKTGGIHGLVEIQTAQTNQDFQPVNTSLYMYTYKKWREKNNLTKGKQLTNLDPGEAKKRLIENRKQMLATAITYNEWMTHHEEQKHLMRVIQPAEKIQENGSAKNTMKSNRKSGDP